MYWVRVGVIFGLIFSFALLGIALQRRFGRRSVRNWAGSGPNPDLTPAEAALLLSQSVNVIVAMRLLDPIQRRVLRLKLARPLTLVATEEVPPQERDEPALRALDSKGRLRGDGVVDLLEDLYDRVNEKMVGYSGNSTLELLEEKVDGLWAAVLADGIPNDDVIPWLLLREPEEVWETLPEGGRWALLRDLYRVLEQIRAGVTLPAPVGELRRERPDGFFRWHREPHA